MTLRRIGLTTFFIVALCLLGSARSLLAQDPVSVAGDMYKVLAENGRIRVLDVQLAPGAKTAMHSHPDLVAVVLEPSTVKWTRADGQSAQSGPEFKRGGVQTMTSDAHVSENIGSTPLHVILVEFKGPAPAAGQGREPSLPALYKQVADTPHARVFEISVAPGQTVPQHTHGNHVMVSLADGTAELTDAAGGKQPLEFKKDTAMIGGPATHSAVNTGKTPVQLILVELK